METDTTRDNTRLGQIKRGDFCRYNSKRKIGKGEPIKFKSNGQQLLAIDYHRNGISGLPFHVAIVKEKGEGESRNMLVIRFSKDADQDTGQVVCAAFDIAKLSEGDIRFFFNSWRGDHYHDLIDKYLSQTQSTQTENKPLGTDHPQIWN